MTLRVGGGVKGGLWKDTQVYIGHSLSGNVSFPVHFSHEYIFQENCQGVCWLSLVSCGEEPGVRHTDDILFEDVLCWEGPPSPLLSTATTCQKLASLSDSNEYFGLLHLNHPSTNFPEFCPAELINCFAFE